MFRFIREANGIVATVRATLLIIVGCLCAQSATAGEPGLRGPHETSLAPFVIANTEFTLTHELMHVLIDEANIPVMGREEDFADYLATTLLLTMDNGPLPPETVDRLQAIIDAWRVEWTIIEQDRMDIAYSDPHALEIQRLFDMVCLTYGRQPQGLADFRIANELPRDRADLCAEDFAKAARGLQFLQTTFGADDPDNQLAVTFDVGESPSHAQYREWLSHQSVISQIVGVIDTAYAFPRPIDIRFRSCGQANAYWEPADAQVVMCYELMDRFIHLSRFRQEYAVDRREWTLGVEKAKNALK